MPKKPNSRYDRLFALIHQAARQDHLRRTVMQSAPPSPCVGHRFRDMATRSLGRAAPDQTLRDALRP